MEVTVPRHPDQEPEQDSMSHWRRHCWRPKAPKKQALPKGPYWHPLAQETGTSGHSHLETPLLYFTLPPTSPPARAALLIQSHKALSTLPGSSVHGDSPGKNTGVGCHALLQGIFPTQGSKLGLLPQRQIFYCLSQQGCIDKIVYLQNFKAILLLIKLVIL